MSRHETVPAINASKRNRTGKGLGDTASAAADSGVLTDSVPSSDVIAANPEEPAVSMLLAASYWSRSSHRRGA
jgi:hypothetical protein